MWDMRKIFARLKHVLRGPFITDLPPELAQCEDSCRVGECSHGKWLTCENRIRRMREETRCSRSPGAQAMTLRRAKAVHWLEPSPLEEALSRERDESLPD